MVLSQEELDTETITVDWGTISGDLVLDIVGAAPTSCANNSLVGISVFSTIAPLAPQSLDDCQNNVAPTLVATSSNWSHSKLVRWIIGNRNLSSYWR
jgi:hypothetical protein